MFYHLYEEHWKIYYEDSLYSMSAKLWEKTY